jgi:hypothetical protein
MRLVHEKTCIHRPSQKQTATIAPVLSANVHNCRVQSIFCQVCRREKASEAADIRGNPKTLMGSAVSGRGFALNSTYKIYNYAQLSLIYVDLKWAIR